jgi:hypothetical protein
MHITQYITNQELLKQYIADGVVNVRKHETLPLQIYCYGKRATYDDIWDEVTCKTRGLIVDDYGGIVARPFEKFFNVGHNGRPETSLEALALEPHEPLIYEKLDGSMATLYTYDGQAAIASKGSFHSEHATWASEWYREHCYRFFEKNDLFIKWPKGYTPVFEMICQEVQHHVVHYEKDGLILIGLINNESGEEMSHDVLRLYGDQNEIEVVKRHDISLYQALNENRPNTEGYVAIWFRNGAPALKVKIKHEDFLRLQRLRNNLTPKTVYRALAKIEGDIQDIYDFLEGADTFLADQVIGWITNYKLAYEGFMIKAKYTMLEALASCDTRKEFAAVFTSEKHREVSAICFKMLDLQDHRPAVWKLVYPVVAQQRYTPEEE